MRRDLNQLSTPWTSSFATSACNICFIRLKTLPITSLITLHRLTTFEYSSYKDTLNLSFHSREAFVEFLFKYSYNCCDWLNIESDHKLSVLRILKLVMFGFSDKNATVRRFNRKSRMFLQMPNLTPQLSSNRMSRMIKDGQLSSTTGNRE
jgi:hypothetical protein